MFLSVIHVEFLYSSIIYLLIVKNNIQDLRDDYPVGFLSVTTLFICFKQILWARRAASKERSSVVPPECDQYLSVVMSIWILSVQTCSNNVSCNFPLMCANPCLP